ncbi:OmpA family protein [Nannocystaceae bacterium ST9]
MNHRTLTLARASMIVVGLACVTSGCITKKEHAALQAELDKTRAALTDSEKRATDLETALAETEAEVDRLGGEITNLKDQLALAEARASDAETELAGVLKDKSKLTASIEDMQNALAELQRQQALADARAAEYRAVLAKFKQLIDSGKLKAKVVDGRLVLELQTDILFPSGSAKLSKDGLATIQEVSKLLAEIPDRKYQVEGHTDNVPIKTQQYPSNWELAADRSINVVRAMVDAGMPGARISAAAFADTRPAVSNATPEGQAQNRRIEIAIVPDLSSLPGAADIEKMFGGKS